jgi:Peptidase family M28
VTIEPALAGRAREIRAAVDPGRLRAHVERLAEPRSRRHAAEGMARAEAYVTRCLERAGWSVGRRPFQVPDGGVGTNLLAERVPGTTGATYLIGAHLDTVPDSPGADDNASGIACLLELAGTVGSLSLRHDVLLAVFDEEETGLHGSRALARELAGQRAPVGAVIYECVGFHSGQAGSQRLPTGMRLIYPGQYRQVRRRGFRGDWTLLAYRGAASAARLSRALADCLALLAGRDTVILARDPGDLPVTGRLLHRYAPWLDNLYRSDHKPFWDLGLPAVLVTDTADFRNPHYHQPTDTPQTLDYERMADLVGATATALVLLDG